jgi:hypothetical protein
MKLIIEDDNGQRVLTIETVEDQLLFGFGYFRDREYARAGVIEDITHSLLDHFPRPENLPEEFINAVCDEVKAKTDNAQPYSKQEENV